MSDLKTFLDLSQPLFESFTTGRAKQVDFQKLSEKIGLCLCTSSQCVDLGMKAKELLEKWHNKKGRKVANVDELITILKHKDVELTGIAEDIEDLMQKTLPSTTSPSCLASNSETSSATLPKMKNKFSSSNVAKVLMEKTPNILQNQITDNNQPEVEIPKCTTCGNKVDLRICQKGDNKGRKYYKCSIANIPACKKFFRWVEEDEVNGDVKCDCGDTAVKEKVKKEGMNQGRIFYHCRKMRAFQCRFWKWEQVTCHCEEEARREITKKQGPNHGKAFYKCAKMGKDKCTFWKWEEEVMKGSTKRESMGRDENYQGKKLKQN